MPDAQRILGRLEGDELFGWAMLMSDRRALEARITNAAKAALMKRGYPLGSTTLTYEGYVVTSDDETVSSDGRAVIESLGVGSIPNRDGTGPTES